MKFRTIYNLKRHRLTHTGEKRKLKLKKKKKISTFQSDEVTLNNHSFLFLSHFISHTQRTDACTANEPLHNQVISINTCDHTLATKHINAICVSNRFDYKSNCASIRTNTFRMKMNTKAKRKFNRLSIILILFRKIILKKLEHAIIWNK